MHSKTKLLYQSAGSYYSTPREIQKLYTRGKGHRSFF